MNFANQWSTLICLSSASCVIIDLILPSGKMEKPLRMVLGLFLIASMLFPFSNGVPKINMKFTPVDKNSNKVTKFAKNVNEQFKFLVEKNLENIVKETLKNCGVENDRGNKWNPGEKERKKAEKRGEKRREKVEILMDTNQDGCISINKCKVYIPKDFKKRGSNSILTSSEISEIGEELERRLSIETEVVMVD